MSWVKKQIGNEWYKYLSPIIQSNEFKSDFKKIANQYGKVKCYPDINQIFRCFEECKFEDLKIVLIGLDPYINGQATGLCFETEGKYTPTINQMYTGYTKEYPSNFNVNFLDGKLAHWANQGMLMYNTALTVEKGKTNSHALYWKYFTTELFKKLNKLDKSLLFIAWGNAAQNYTKLITNSKHTIINATHPVSASYTGTEWDSKGNFKFTEKWIKENYNLKWEW